MNNNQSIRNEDILTAWVRIGLILMLGITIVMVFIAMVSHNTKGEASIGSFGAKDYNEGWTLTYNGSKETVSLPAYVDCKSGEEVVISNTLPSNLSNSMSLMVRSTMEDIVVYVDGRLREEYSTNSTSDMCYYLPSAYVITNLNENDSGKDLTFQARKRSKGKRQTSAKKSPPEADSKM